jgi:antitoxin component YwqK of YwqJK toxin-antitoxin module
MKTLNEYIRSTNRLSLVAAVCLGLIVTATIETKASVIPWNRVVKFRGRAYEAHRRNPRMPAGGPFTGRVIDKYSNGQVHYEGQYRDGIKTGRWVQWHPNGVKKEEFYYHNGHMHGPYFSWYTNGKIRIKARYTHGKLTADNAGCNKAGQVIQRHTNGYLAEEKLYRDGLLSLRLEWYDNGRLKRETAFQDGRKNGWEKYWYENGARKEKTRYYNGKKNGLSISWYKTGQQKHEVTYWNGTMNGLYTEWYPNGHVKMSGYYFDGIPSETWIFRTNDGQIEFVGQYYAYYNWKNTPVAVNTNTYAISNPDWNFDTPYVNVGRTHIKKTDVKRMRFKGSSFKGSGSKSSGFSVSGMGRGASSGFRR